jgi:RNA polymerase sigma-70 factor (ECF subfamily)
VNEAALLVSLRMGEEAAFTWLVEQYHPSLMRLAGLFVHDEAVAEELAQETWLAVLQGLDHFEGRSSLKTWIFTILANKAKTRGQREKRTVSLTELDDSLPALSQSVGSDQANPTVDPGRFNDPSAEKWPGHWALGSKPVSWVGIPEDTFISQETMSLIRQAIGTLPEVQRTVITLRDVHEFSSEEVCNVLGISETNQRVLLHRARARVRQTLEDYFRQAEL